MKLLAIFLVGVAVTSASLFGRKSINIKDDGTMVIRSEYGKQLMITKKITPYGQWMMEIEVNGPFGIGKRIQINDQNQVGVTSENDEKLLSGNQRVLSGMDGNWNEVDDNGRIKRSLRQSDLVSEIIKEYRGVVDEESYENLLKKVHKAVKKGEINPVILEHLESLVAKKPWNSWKSWRGESENLMEPQIRKKHGLDRWSQMGMWWRKPMYSQNWALWGNMWNKWRSQLQDQDSCCQKGICSCGDDRMVMSSEIRKQMLNKMPLNVRSLESPIESTISEDIMMPIQSTKSMPSGLNWIRSPVPSDMIVNTSPMESNSLGLQWAEDLPVNLDQLTSSNENLPSLMKLRYLNSLENSPDSLGNEWNPSWNGNLMQQVGTWDNQWNPSWKSNLMQQVGTWDNQWNPTWKSNSMEQVGTWDNQWNPSWNRNLKQQVGTWDNQWNPSWNNNLMQQVGTLDEQWSPSWNNNKQKNYRKH